MAKMTSSDFLAVRGKILAIALLVDGIKIDDFLASIREAETLGPILRPSEYLMYKQDLDDLYALGLAVRDIKIIVENIKFISKKSLADYLKR